jgi:hypothetical protein
VGRSTCPLPQELTARRQYQRASGWSSFCLIEATERPGISRIYSLGIEKIGGVSIFAMVFQGARSLGERERTLWSAQRRFQRVCKSHACSSGGDSNLQKKRESLSDLLSKLLSLGSLVFYHSYQLDYPVIFNNFQFLIIS